LQKLFHISEEPDIKIFNPRPSPQFYGSIKDDVVFAISEKMLHNYLLPRDCPRVAYYKNPDTTEEDRKKFFGEIQADYIINVEENWEERIRYAKLYLYEFPSESFMLLDKTAGYYISYESVIPASVTEMKGVIDELNKRKAGLRFLQNLQKIAEEVKNSTLSYSIIRIKNAKL
jgi:hypothetical protein